MTDTSDNNKKTLSLNLSKIDPVKVQERLRASQGKVYTPPPPSRSSFQKPFPSGSSSSSLTPDSFRKFQPKPYGPKPSTPPVLTKAQKKEIARKEREAKKKAKALKHLKETKRAVQEGAANRFYNIQKALIWLQTTYPHCFNLNFPKPLKVNITHEILQELPENLDFSKTILRQAIQYYTGSPKYREVLLITPLRYNLKGEQEGVVTSQQQEKAIEEIAQLKKYKEKVYLEQQQKHQEWQEKQKTKKNFQGTYEKLQQNTRLALKLVCEDIVKLRWFLRDYREKPLEEMFLAFSNYKFNIPSLLQMECKGLLFFLDTLPDKTAIVSVDYKLLKKNKAFWMVKTKTTLYRVWIRAGYVGAFGGLSHQIEEFFHKNRGLFQEEGIRDYYHLFRKSIYEKNIKKYPQPGLLRSLMFIDFLNKFKEGKSEKVTDRTTKKLNLLVHDILTTHKQHLPEEVVDKETLCHFCSLLFTQMIRQNKKNLRFGEVLDEIAYKSTWITPCPEGAVPVSILYNDFYIAGLRPQKDTLLPLIKEKLKQDSEKIQDSKQESRSEGAVPRQTFVLNRFTPSWIKENEVILLT